jgi:hypothetical protein
MGHYDDFYDKDDVERDKQFQKRLSRRNQLVKIIKKKYPEIMELLSEYYEERNWT